MTTQSPKLIAGEEEDGLRAVDERRRVDLCVAKIYQTRKCVNKRKLFEFCERKMVQKIRKEIVRMGLKVCRFSIRTSIHLLMLLTPAENTLTDKRTDRSLILTSKSLLVGHWS